MKAYTNVAQLLKSRENAVDMSTCRNFYQMQQAVARTFQGKEWMRCDMMGPQSGHL